MRECMHTNMEYKTNSTISEGKGEGMEVKVPYLVTMTPKGAKREKTKVVYAMTSMTDNTSSR